MDAELLARLQFTLTASYHFIFPPLSMGLGLMLLVVSGLYLRTRDPKWRRLSFFWVKVYGIVFAMGVATGIVQEFEFGMNWADYSRFVGNIFGSLLAAEGVFAFFLEGGFLGLMLFGGNRLGPRMWFLASAMVVIGAHFSAIWIVAANSWMQTPAGYDIQALPEPARAVMTDFWATVLTPSFMPRLLHVFFASWTAGAAFVASVSAYYVLRARHADLGRASLAVAVPFFIVFAVANAFVFGPESARSVAENQPTKLAAMEGTWQTEASAPAYLVGWVDEEAGTTTGIAVPGLLSFLATGDPNATIEGIDSFETPPTVVNLTFQSYHLMVGLGFAIVPFALLAGGAVVLEAQAPGVPLGALDPRLDGLRVAHRHHRRLVGGGVRSPALDRLRDAADCRWHLAGGVRGGDRRLAGRLHPALHHPAGALPVPPQQEDPARTGAAGEPGGPARRRAA